jgi:iron-sulfur cluster repair protein YtfE (RIC family)
MHDDRMRWDDRLADLEVSLRSGDRADALAKLLAFDGELTRCVHGEEREVFPALERFASVPPLATARMRSEHRSLRRLVDAMGELIAREDHQRGLDVLATLRSVLLLHVAKEDWMLYPLVQRS